MSQERGPGLPSYLPDALTGLPNPSGSPDDLFQRSKDFSRAAAQLDAIGGDVSVLLLQASGRWEGPAEQGFQDFMRGRPRAFRVVAAGYRKVGAALKEYASALEQAQQTFTASRRLEEADRFRQTGSDNTSPLDLFTPDRIRARGQLEAALERLHASTVRTSGVLRGLESGLSPRPPVKPDIYRGRGGSLMQAGSEVKEKASEDLQALWDEHRLVMPGQARQAWQEHLDSIVVSVTDPLGTAGDMAYADADVEEAMAGNDARWAAGVAYSLLTWSPMRGMRWFNAAKHRHRHRDHDQP